MSQSISVNVHNPKITEVDTVSLDDANGPTFCVQLGDYNTGEVTLFFYGPEAVARFAAHLVQQCDREHGGVAVEDYYTMLRHGTYATV